MSDPTSVDDESSGEIDTSSEALATTSTPGKAVWTKLYRRTYRDGEGSTMAATEVASDENGHAYVARAEQMFHAHLDPWRRDDLTKYDGYGELKWRVRTQMPATDVAARRGLVAVTEGAQDPTTLRVRSRVEVFDAATGALRWSREFRNQEHFGATSVAIDDSGNIVVAGSVEGAADIGGGPLRTPSGTENENDAFVASYTMSGELRWAKRFGSGSSSIVHALAFDSTGDVYLGGDFIGSLDAGDNRVLVDPLGAYPPTDGFVARLSNGGTVELLKQIGGTSGQNVTHLAVDSDRNIIVGGIFAKTADFGGASVNSADGSTASSSREHFVAKLRPSGDHVWSRAFQGSWARTLRGLAVDSYKQVIVSLNFDSRIKVGDKTFLAETMGHSLLVKLSPSNSVVWTKEYGTTEGNVNTNGLAVTPSARLLMVGSFFGRVNFGGSTFESTYPKGENDLGPTDGFLVRLYQ